jgi:hypothetical protein
MKTFISDIFLKIQRFSQELNDLTLLTNPHWVLIDDILENKTVYIFRKNNELVVSTNGKVERAKWEYLGNSSLLIDKDTKSYFFKQGFYDDEVLAIRVDGSEEYVVFINEKKYNEGFNTINKVVELLKEKYLDPKLKLYIESPTGQKLEDNYLPDKIILKTKKQIEREKMEAEELNKWFRFIIIAILVLTIVIYLSTRFRDQ